MSQRELERAWRRLLELGEDIESAEDTGRDALPLQHEYEQLLARVAREQ